jgi:hypothetical protein
MKGHKYSGLIHSSSILLDPSGADLATAIFFLAYSVHRRVPFIKMLRRGYCGLNVEHLTRTRFVRLRSGTLRRA